MQHQPHLSVKLLTAAEIPDIIRYWLTASESFLHGMGVDIPKMPTEQEWESFLATQVAAPDAEKQSYCMVWLLDGAPVGHSNVNKITPGDSAYMHLHMWQAHGRQAGLGVQFLKLAIPHFFATYQLQRLYCEPWALNPAPNRTLPKAGFTHVRNYVTIPGWLSFEQEVALWEMTRQSAEQQGII